MVANETGRADWNGASGESWVADADRRDVSLAPVLDELLRAAALGEGERVVDLGCGCGATSLAAAGAVGTDGHVLGLDISETMLAVARRRASSAPNVEFVARDAQVDEIPGGNDVAISRFGTMFFDDPGAAFANIGRSLRTGGRLCIATWQPLDTNTWITVPGAALREFGELPVAVPGTPGMFSQSSTGTIVEVLDAAGFIDIDVRSVVVPYHLGSDAADAASYIATVGLARAVLDPLSPDDRSAALAAVTDVLAEHVDAGGVTLDAAILVTTASR